MGALLVTSPHVADGKTAIASGLLSLFSQSGLINYARIVSERPHADAVFMKSAFGLAHTADDMSRTEKTPIEAFSPFGREPMIVESDGSAGTTFPSLIVSTFHGSETVADIQALIDGLEAQPIGVILNGAPMEQKRTIERLFLPEFKALGVPLLGILPESRALRGGTASDLAAFLEAEILAAEHALGNVIESYMVGAMSHQGASSISYFNRFENKCVVTGGNRIDTHMGALGTPCRALVMTGGYDPDPVVIERAEGEDVPILKVWPDTAATMENIGLFMRGMRFHQEFKVPIIADLLRAHVDLAPIEAALGITVAGRV